MFHALLNITCRYRGFLDHISEDERKGAEGLLLRLAGDNGDPTDPKAMQALIQLKNIWRKDIIKTMKLQVRGSVSFIALALH